MTSISWSRALAWRLGQHRLDPVGTDTVPGVVGRLGAVQAGDGWAAELSIRTRRARSEPGEVERSLAEGRLVRTYAFRGATHLLTPEDGGAYLALRAASRMWELPSWQRHYRLQPEDWPHLRDVVREALVDGPLTTEELGDAVTTRRRFRHLVPVFAQGAHTLLKPLAWQGVMSFGPPRGKRATFQGLDQNPHWRGVPDLDEAGRFAVEQYVRAYGPTTVERVHYWLGEGLGAGRRRIRTWFAELGDRLVEVDVGGEPAHVLRGDLDALQSTAATNAVRLLPAYDQWVLGPGTADGHVVPASQRALVSRGANPVVVTGVVSGTWRLVDDRLTVDWFTKPPADVEDRLADEVGRLGLLLGRTLEPPGRTAPR